MKAAARFITRQSGWPAFLFLLYALLNGCYVCEGLWQGSGLHGYTVQSSTKGFPHLVSTWASFVQMLVLTGLSAVMLGVNLWHKRKASSAGNRYQCTRRGREA